MFSKLSKFTKESNSDYFEHQTQGSAMLLVEESTLSMKEAIMKATSMTASLAAMVTTVFSTVKSKIY